VRGECGHTGQSGRVLPAAPFCRCWWAALGWAACKVVCWFAAFSLSLSPGLKMPALCTFVGMQFTACAVLYCRIMLESFVATQKLSVQKALRKKFRKFLSAKADFNGLVLLKLQASRRGTACRGRTGALTGWGRKRAEAGICMLVAEPVVVICCGCKRCGARLWFKCCWAGVGGAPQGQVLDREELGCVCYPSCAATMCGPPAETPCLCCLVSGVLA